MGCIYIRWVIKTSRFPELNFEIKMYEILIRLRERVSITVVTAAEIIVIHYVNYHENLSCMIVE